jgi:hypothetical protein
MEKIFNIERHDKIFLIIFTAFISLLFLWNIFTPILEGADEVGHFCSIDYIAHEKKIPNVLINDGCFIWHPPLYYALLSPFTIPFNLPRFDPVTLRKNPKVNLLRKGEFAQFIHTKEELLFKWNSLQFEIHFLRLLTSLFAIFIFLITWKISGIVFSSSTPRYLSLLLFFNPMFLHIFSTLTNVTLISLFATLIIAIDIKYKRNRGYMPVFIQGLILGLGFITKITAVFLIPAWLIVTFIEYRRNKYSLTKVIIQTTIFLIGFFITAGWYILRNLLLYGEIIEASAIAKKYGQSYHELLLKQVGLLNYVNSIVLTFFKTFWSGYGALTIRFPEILNVLLLIMTILVTYVLFLKRKHFNHGLTVSVIYAISIIGGLFIMNFRLSAMHAKDLFPAYMPLALLFGYGLFNLRGSLSAHMPKIILVLLTLTGTYMFAQNAIIKYLKGILGTPVQTEKLLPEIIFKLTITVFIMSLMIFLFKRFKFNDTNIIKVANSLAIIDLLILFISTYLLYKNFIF